MKAKLTGFLEPTLCLKGYFGMQLLRLLLLFAVPVTAVAQLTYETNNGTLTITGYTGPGGLVTIPSVIEGLPVTSIGDEAFHSLTTLTSVLIPDTVTNIGFAAFVGCTDLTHVTLGKAVNIGGVAFRYCSSLTSIDLPDSVRTIGSGAFGYCSSLASVTFGVGPLSIESGAFNYCTNLSSVVLPDSLTSIESCFEFCNSLTNITVAPLNPFYSSSDGVLFDKNQRTLLTYPGGRAGAYTIPATVTLVNDRAFLGCSRLTDVAIPSNVTRIGRAAFASTALNRLNLPSSITEIADMTFSGCRELTNFNLGDSLRTIGSAAFFICGKLTEVTIPNTVTYIGEAAFYNCSNMTSVTIPEGVSSIDKWAFAGCALTTVTIPASVRTVGDGLFRGCVNLSAEYFRGNAPDWILNNPLEGFGGNDSIVLYYLPGTTGWGDTFANRPTALWALPNPLVLMTPPSFGMQAGRFGFTISWATNASVVVEACTDFASPLWSPVSTNTLNAGSSYFSDPDWAKYPARIYRVRWP